jgi:hypothetical protein
MASGSLASAALSRSGPTVIAAAVPIRLSAATLSGWRAAVSSAISEPMEWPTSFALGAPAASISAAVQSAISAIVGNGLPGERPWPGRSGASTEKP